jgi:hypothetical protein
VDDRAPGPILLGRARLYSELAVFTRLRQRNVAGTVVPGVVRSFTLATRARPGFARIVHHYGDQYASWPADFFMAHVRLLATYVTPARFRSIVAPLAAHVARQENATGCTGGS